MSKTSKKLEEIKNMVNNLDINYDEIDLSVLQNFVGITKKLNDERMQYKVKPNANTWNEIHYFAVSHEKWLKTFLELPSGNTIL